MDQLVRGNLKVQAEPVRPRVAQIFMPTMANHGLSQLVVGPACVASHTMDRVFSVRHEDGDLNAGHFK